MTPFFSIIIPLYNSGKTLQRTLDSITCQRFKDFELVLVDGGSVDDTRLIIANLQKTKRLAAQFISGPDQGIYDAMNKGIGMATGQWLYFMGGDDMLAGPNTLQTVYNAIKHHTAHLFYGNVTGAESGTRYADDTPDKVLSRGIHHQGIFYKREIFDYTGKYDLRFKVAADYHLTIKIFCNTSFKTQYINTDIAFFGEAGLSSTLFDYPFYSYRYRLLAQNQATDKITAKAACLDQSIYCCLYLAKEKDRMGFAWANLLFYLTTRNPTGIPQRLRSFWRMIAWSLKITG
ncbi:glycosyltransferase family 2 protein [Mucilaginibacter lutimaris]|uniref:Glycosyltransferase family 2 protein n=1 Tax=Mucilaginibacter lutimaris TaxID=931629 RepID=A0ABW2ZGX2_9SPHI